MANPEIELCFPFDRIVNRTYPCRSRVRASPIVLSQEVSYVEKSNSWLCHPIIGKNPELSSSIHKRIQGIFFRLQRHPSEVYPLVNLF
eukprot:scaffold48121_cov47-Attheya_sp.AAC.11